ncbi:hypothetical protein DMENIID0001_119540 [Sergentomyia squamirostris]
MGGSLMEHGGGPERGWGATSSSNIFAPKALTLNREMKMSSQARNNLPPLRDSGLSVYGVVIKLAGQYRRKFVGHHLSFTPLV